MGKNSSIVVEHNETLEELNAESEGHSQSTPPLVQEKINNPQSMEDLPADTENKTKEISVVAETKETADKIKNDNASYKSLVKYTKSFRKIESVPTSLLYKEVKVKPASVKTHIPPLNDEEKDDLAFKGRWFDQVELKIDTTFSRNKPNLIHMVMRWKQCLQKKKISELLIILDAILADPNHKIFLDNPLNKMSISIAGQATQSISFYQLIYKIRRALPGAAIKTTTQKWFETRFITEISPNASLMFSLATEDLPYTPEQMTKMIDDFFVMLIVENHLDPERLKNLIMGQAPQQMPATENPLRQVTCLALKKAKELFLEQVKSDLKAIDQSCISNFNVNDLSSIKYITIGDFKRDPGVHLEPYVTPANYRDFAICLDMLKEVNLPHFESLLILDFMDSTRKTNLNKLITLIDKNYKSLRTIKLGQGFPPDSVELIRERLKKYPFITLHAFGPIPEPSETNKKKPFKFFEKIRFSEDKKKQSNDNTLSPPMG
ncbi:Uncharacterised protein [Legionella lansingensis]|uniref:Uncharacterized protein n=1 Tax=Legionella lansingensis TaxID=45067 RepID=A0A0W0VZ86_9GAMM|nr:hypothetical protein [Legionella lansingensis]KTD25435.1 hypothetical protein Llan_0181 [Legionella lansingensis]SNV51443.1 Uncharacterised protein [Legionella lansingensis]